MLKQSRKFLAWIALICMLLSVSLNSYTAAADQGLGVPQAEETQENTTPGDISSEDVAEDGSENEAAEAVSSGDVASAGDLAPEDEGGESGSLDVPDTFNEETDPEVIHQHIVNQGLANYGEGGEFNPKMTMTLTNPTDTEFLAGNVVTYTVYFEFPPSETWGEGYDGRQPLFDWYENNQVTVTLPAGLLLTGAGLEGMIDTENPNNPTNFIHYDEDDPTNTNPNIEHTYVLPFWDKIAADTTFRNHFTFTVYISNNGTAESLHQYDFAQDMVHFTTTLKVLDKQDPNNYVPAGEYPQEIKLQGNSFTTTSPDLWGVKKTGVEASLEGNIVTYIWDVEVGLMEGDEVKHVNADYSRPGRNWLESMTLADVYKTVVSPDDTLSDDDEVVTATSDFISAVIQRQSATSEAFEAEQPFTNESTTVIWGTGANENLKMHSQMLIDLDGDSTNSPEQLTPKYTKYRITAKYQVNDDWIAQFPTLVGNKLIEQNTATTTATLAKVTLPQISDDTKTQKVTLPLDGPARLFINKRFTDYTGTESDYTAALQALYGAIPYKISADRVFDIYENKGTEQAPIYEKYEGLQGENNYILEQGKYYYLEPGITYTLIEDLSPEQQNAMQQTDEVTTIVKTPVANERWNETFHNKETVGKLIVTKWDDSERKMTDTTQSAGFTLLDSNHQPIGSEQFTVSAIVTFERLPYGTYYLRETTVPSGYVAAVQGDLGPIVIDEDHTVINYDVVNKQTMSRVTLTKYIGVTEDPITNKANANYPATFTLQRTAGDPTDDSTVWETVQVLDGNGNEVNRVNGQGIISANMEAFNSSGQPYWYRFVEQIPEGYYDPATGSTTIAYSQAVKLTTVEGGVEVARPMTSPVNVDMFNRRFVRAHVQKNFYTAQTNGTLKVDYTRSTTVKLYAYTKANYSDLHEVPASVSSPEPDNVVGTASNKWVDWKNLPAYAPSGNNDGTSVRVHYLVKEEPVDTYLLDTAATNNTGHVVTINGVDYVELNATPSGNEGSSDPSGNQPTLGNTLLINVQNLYPVRIYKRNYYTNANLAGTSVTIYNADGTPASGRVGSATADVTTLTDVAVPQAGVYIFLAPGQTYTFAETKNTTGLVFHSLSDNGQISFSTTGNNAQTYANKDRTKNTTRYMYNAPYPLIDIKKVDSNTNAPVNGAVFTVYTKNADGTFSPVLKDGNPVTVNTNLSTVNGNTTIRLEPGDYYFAETTVPDGYLDPNENFDFYHDLSSDYEQGTVSGTSTVLTFVKGKVENMQKDGNKDNTCTFTFKNIRNGGSLKVVKYVDGVRTNGYKIVVSVNNVPVDDETTVTVGNETGVAIFNNLPVYEADGTTKIVYSISEEMTPDQQRDYVQSSTNQTATLTLGEMTSTDASNNELAVYNVSKIDIEATKVFVKPWEYSFTEHRELLAGATIGLFERSGDNWVLVDPATLINSDNPQVSDNSGEVHFNGLARGKDYIMVELASGDPKKFPWKDGVFKQFPAGGAGTTSIPDSELDLYNVIEISGTTTLNTSGKPSEGRETFPKETAYMINANHWVQFDITKWLDPVANRILTADQFGRGKQFDPYVEANGFNEADNVIFEVFRYVMQEGEETVNFNLASPEPWESLGRYTTGTLYVNDIRQIGEFITSADQNIDEHYVYMIVEIDEGPNSFNANPNFQYTFFYQQDPEQEEQTYTATVTGGTARQVTYVMDQVNFEDVLNYTEVGPGTTLYLIASIRISKFQDSYDEETGNLKEDYQPLPGATFEVRLDNGKVIAEMTVGLDTHLSTSANPLAIAQSGTFGLKINKDTDGNVTSYDLIDYEAQKTYENVTVEPGTFTHEGHTFPCWYLPVTVVETKVPDGFSSTTGDMDMYLTFVDVTTQHQGESWVFNDAYLVTTIGTNTTETLAADQTDTSWYVRNASDANHVISLGNGVGDIVNPSPLRIVNLPTTNTTARVFKYGYTPNASTVNLTGDQLNGVDPDSISRINMTGVKMVIQRKDGNNWRFWNYNEGKLGDYGTQDQATFTSDNGFFRFPKGLPEGTYRIYETSIGTGVNGNYEMTYTSERPRVFVVKKAAVDIYLYNPKGFGFRIFKEDMAGNPLAGTQFKIHSSSVAWSGTTSGSDGSTYLSIMKSGNYWIEETMAGYSSAYLQQYLNSTYKNEDGTPYLNGFTTSPGIFFGYTYTSKSDGKEGTDVIISKVSPSTDILGAPGEFWLTIKNPKTTNLKLTKYDEYDTEQKLQNAEFIVLYLPFDKTSGDISVELPTIAKGTNASNATSAFKAKNTNWVRRYVTNADPNTLVTSGVNPKTNASGEISLNNIDPGIYAFYEITTPTNYDVVTDTSGNALIYTAVVKGDMPVNVTVTPSSVTVKDYSGTTPTDKTVTTNSVSNDGTLVDIEVSNRPKVTLKALKEVESGLIENPNWRVVLNLYTNSSKTTKVGTVTLTSATNQGTGITFKNPSNSQQDALFSLGTTYYLEEEISLPTRNFLLNEVLKGGEVISDIAGGLYLFPVESIDGFTITVRNDYLYGLVNFSKVDSANHLVHLSGAAFEVRYKNDAGEWVKVPNSTVTEVMNGDQGTGDYKATIPLVRKEPTVYRIYETEAPTDYLLPADYYFEVTLSLTDMENYPNVSNYDIELENSEGNELVITKYTYQHGAEQNPQAGKNSAKFAIYHYVNGSWVLEKEDWVGENGRLTYLTVPGDQYAVKETDFDRTQFNLMDSIYQIFTDSEQKLISQSLTLADGTVVEDVYALTVVNDLATINVSAFNVPNLTPTIVKEDVGKYQAGATYPKNNVKAYMSFNIYEITEADGDIYNLTGETQPTRAQVEAFLATKTDEDIVFSGITENYSTTLPNGTTKIWESNDVNKRWSASKMYLLVETAVGAKDGGAYNTLQKDNPAVVWYYRIPKNPSKTTWTLYNYYGDASVEIEKAFVNKTATDTENDLVDGKVDSLLEGERKTVFTLSPSVTSQNQMLDGFVITEKGLTATDKSNGAVDDFDYSFTKIEVGGASHFVEKLGLTEEEAVISAKIVFYTGLNAEEGTEISGADVVVPNVNNADPVTAIPTNAKSFTISYYSDAVTAATAAYDHEYLPAAEGKAAVTFNYVLGESFQAQPTKVYVTLKQQEDVEYPDYVKEVRHVKNDSGVELSYPKWEADGSGLRPAGNKDTASATIDVNTFKLPLVAIRKKVPSTTARLGGTVTYTIEIENVRSSPVEFKYPIALDILPTAVTYVDGSAPLKVTASGGEEFDVATSVIQGGPSVVTTSGVEVSEYNKAILFKFTGATLGIGSTITISYTCLIAETADLFTNVLQNDVYLTSSDKSYHTEENRHGYPFKNEGNDWGNTLDNAARNLGGTAQARENAMNSNGSLGDYATDEYEWVAARVEQNINEQTTVTLRKAVMGDRDEGGFHDTKVGVATRTNHRFFNESGDPNTDQEGWVQWRLSVVNGYTDREYLDHLIIGDVIPNPGDGDQRESAWYLDYDQILYVENNRVEITPDQYTVYFYTGTTASAEAKLLECMNAGGDTTGWTAESALDSMTEAERAAFMHSISAFVVIFDEDIKLLKNTSMYLIYETDVVNNEDDTDFNNNRAFKNDANYYFFHYYDPEVTTSMKSNTVSVMITDRPVEIQGDLWIDEDQDGVQEATNRRDYSRYAIVNALVAATSFSIKDLREASGATSTNDTGDLTQWDGGESVKHFRFEGLGASVAKRYEYTSGDDPKLDWHALKGEDPYRYSLIANIADTGDLLKIFSISQLGDGHYLSDDPDATAFVNHTAATFLDNNFDGSNGTYTTYPFYVRYSNNVDQSKDLGVKSNRTLELTKLAADNPEVVIKGAKFEIYGPFGDREMIQKDGSIVNARTEAVASGNPLKFSTKTENGKTIYVLDPEGTKTTLETDANGKLYVEGLNWWKEYDIKEIEAGDGYELENMKAMAVDGSGTQIVTYLDNESTDDDNVFTLRVPSTDRVTEGDEVTVTNERKVKIQLNVEKILETYSEDEFDFTFRYWVKSITPDATAALNTELSEKNSATKPIETKTLSLSGNKTSGKGTTTGSFDELTLTGAGTYVFTIKEDAPDPLPTGWSYDPHVERDVTVTVTWDDTTDPDNPKLVASYAYSEYKDTIGDNEYEAFTNSYEATGEWTPTAYKVLEGRPLQPKEFTFTVKEGDTVVSTGYVTDEYDEAAGGYKVVFTKIEYDLRDLGEHSYTITEDAGSMAGVTYATNSIGVTIKLEDTEYKGNIEVTEETYNPAAKKFLNTFHAEGEWAPVVKKKLTGTGMEDGEEFKQAMTFNVSVTDTDADPDAVVLTGEATVTKSAQLEDFTFVSPTDSSVHTVKYDQTMIGKHHYHIVETVTTALDGVLYDTSEYDVEVEVSYIVTGQDALGNDIYSTVLSVVPDKATNDKPIEFDNTYGAEGSAQFEAKKVVTNGNQEIGTDPYIFTFTLKDATGAVIEEKTAGADGSVKFSAIGYTLADDNVTYTYTITETVGDIHNMVYDQHVVTVKVTPKDNGNGTMTCTPHYYVDDPTAEGGLREVDAAEVTFINEQLYSLKLKKVLEEIEDDDRTFDFTIKLTKDNAPYSNVTAPAGAIDWTETPADSGIYTFKLTHNTEIELVLPAGVQYEIQEVSDGYTVNIEVTKPDGTQISYEASQDKITGEITITTGDHTVIYTNLPGLDIPLTGGRGTLPYTAAGLMMMIAAFGCGLFLRHRKKEERA